MSGVNDGCCAPTSLELMNSRTPHARSPTRLTDEAGPPASAPPIRAASARLHQVPGFRADVFHSPTSVARRAGPRPLRCPPPKMVPYDGHDQAAAAFADPGLPRLPPSAGYRVRDHWHRSPSLGQGATMIPEVRAQSWKENAADGHGADTRGGRGARFSWRSEGRDRTDGRERADPRFGTGLPAFRTGQSYANAGSARRGRGRDPTVSPTRRPRRVRSSSWTRTSWARGQGVLPPRRSESSPGGRLIA